MNAPVRKSALVVVEPNEVSASSGFAQQQATVPVDKHVLMDVLARAADVNSAELQHVINVVMRALAEYPNALRSTIEAYAGAVALAMSTGETIELRFTPTPEGDIEAVPTVPAVPAIARALVRGSERAVDILASREMMSGRKFAEMVGVAAQTLNEWREQRKVLALSGAKRGFRYPEWQVLDRTGKLLPGLIELHRILGDQPWSVYRFLRQRHTALGGRTAIESLKSGDIGATIATAKGLSDTFN